MRRAARSDHEETQAEDAAKAGASSASLRAALPSGLVDGAASRWTLPSHVVGELTRIAGPLPSGVVARSGPTVDGELRTRRARGMARERTMLMRGTGSRADAAAVVAHEASHIASGASMRLDRPPRWPDDAAGAWMEHEQRRQRELEEAETGAGREELLAALPAMADDEVRRRVPGIVRRAVARGDTRLAEAAADRLLEVWRRIDHVPATLGVYGPDDTVDNLLDIADAALAAGHTRAGSALMLIVLVQLGRAAAAAVNRRAPDVEGMEGVFAALRLLQQQQEQEILARLDRLDGLVVGHALTANDADDRAMLAALEHVRTVSQRGRAALPDDFGGAAEPAGWQDSGTTAPARRRAPTGVRTAPGPAPPEPTTASSPADRTEAATDAPAPIPAPESLHQGVPEALDNALVMVKEGPPLQYVNVASPRHVVTGTLERAHLLASELFGQRSSVVVLDSMARTTGGERMRRYIVVALNTRIEPPNSPRAEQGETVGFTGVQLMRTPRDRNLFFLTVTAGDWLFFSPALERFVRRTLEEERDVETQELSPEGRRQMAFADVERHLSSDDEQEAANALTYIGASGFRLLDVPTKVRYITLLLEAYTFEAHERTVVEIFRAITQPGPDGTDELPAVLRGLQDNGVLHQLVSDMESQLPTLLMAMGQGRTLSQRDVLALLGELRIITPFPGLEVRGDGSIRVADGVAELRSAVEGLVATITAAVTGIVDIVMDPGAFLEGIAKLVLFSLKLQLAQMGVPWAQVEVARTLGRIGQAVGQGVAGLARLQRAMPPGADFVRDLQRTIEWRILWEILGMFVGVGEALAVLRAIRSGRVADALSDLSRAARAADRIGDAAATSRRGEQAAAEVGEAVSDASRAATSPARAPARTPAPARRPVDIGGRPVRVGFVDGVLRICASPCESYIKRLERLLEALEPPAGAARTRALENIEALRDAFRRHREEVATRAALAASAPNPNVAMADFNTWVRGEAARLAQDAQQHFPAANRLMGSPADEVDAVARSVRDDVRRHVEVGEIFDQEAGRATNLDPHAALETPPPRRRGGSMDGADLLEEIPGGQLSRRQGGRTNANEALWVLDADGVQHGGRARLRETDGSVRGADEVDATRDVGHSGDPGDHGGHIFGHRFMGDTGLVNLFPQNANFNVSAYKKLENEWARWVRAGYEVHVEVRLVRQGGGRPTHVFVEYDVVHPTGGRYHTFEMDFANVPGQPVTTVPRDAL